MEKYIKANTVLNFINSCLEHEDKITDIEKAVLTGVKTCVERISAEDVQPVVYCKDCKHRFNYGICANRGDNWFCGYGERRQRCMKNK